jgi:hypothetical protein
VRGQHACELNNGVRVHDTQVHSTNHSHEISDGISRRHSFGYGHQRSKCDRQPISILLRGCGTSFPRGGERQCQSARQLGAVGSAVS